MEQEGQQIARKWTGRVEPDQKITVLARLEQSRRGTSTFLPGDEEVAADPAQDHTVATGGTTALHPGSSPN